ncbi:MAG: KaiC domain-containing protein, partial [Crenarchaeota archaeon]|nr:KaiC domain-containing protein [Thermoproteota archaeon]
MSSEVVRRVRTRIPGLDEILYGGIPERNIVLVSGG